MSFKQAAEALGVLAIFGIAASIATRLGGRDVEAIASGMTAAVIYGWGIVKFHERARQRVSKSVSSSPAHARYGLVKAK